LVRSVASVVHQTHRPIELVIVNAGASTLAPPRAAAGISLRVVDGGPYNRPQAANAGLTAASGEWIVFLDDDDAFLPGHVESLWRKASASDGALVAYSATRCLDADGRAAATIEVEFDRLKLFSMNYIQIGAALFARSLVDEGCRFDEDFECLQDWDFWLQLAQRTHFVHTGEATNLWSAFSGGSGCGMGSNSNELMRERFRALLSGKWKATGDALQRKVNHHNRLARQAMRAGLADKADAHMVIAERLLRGPARLPPHRAARARRETARGLETRSRDTAGG
jgi:glycosyltransferase involved in cell wall biosynthesis